MTDQPKTAQGWAWNYLKNRLGNVPKLLESSENLPKINTFADLKEGQLFIRFPMFRTENGNLVFKNTELCRKIKPARYMDSSRGQYSAIGIMTGLLQEFPENEPVIVIN
jgi:hypothetical protein